MAATGQVGTFAELYTDLQNRVREQTSVTATENQAKRYINTALFDMHVGTAENLPWAERRAVLVTQPKYTTGTVTITQGSTSLAGASTTWDTANAFGVKNMRAGGKILISGSPEVYEIASVASDTAATLASAFVSDDVSAVSYTYFEDEYALSANFLRPLHVSSFDLDGEVQLLARDEFQRRFVRNSVTGKPVAATIMDLAFSGSATPVRKVRFYRPPDQAYSIPYAFITNKLAVNSSGTELEEMSSDTDEPIIPKRYRHAIVLHALMNWYRDKKDDDRSSEAGNAYGELMVRILGDTELGQRKPRFQPRLSHYKVRAQRPYRTASGRHYVAGSRFDEMR